MHLKQYLTTIVVKSGRFQNKSSVLHKLYELYRENWYLLRKNGCIKKLLREIFC